MLDHGEEIEPGVQKAPAVRAYDVEVHTEDTTSLTPQSKQSVPNQQMSYSLPGPPSSQSPSLS